MYARDAAYSAVKMAEEENDRGVQATNGGTNTVSERIVSQGSFLSHKYR